VDLRRLGIVARSRLAATLGYQGLPVCLSIDVEPDLRLVDRGKIDEPWTGLERLAGEMPGIRERLARHTSRPAHFTWYLRMDPQIAEAWGSAAWVIDRYGGFLGSMRAEGDELGLHIHTWRWDEQAGRWLADRADREWTAHCTQVALDAFRSAIGKRCRAHRGGDRYVDPAMLRLLVDGGVRVDLTVEPGMPAAPGLVPEEPAVGELPDYRAAPACPYRPRSLDDFTSADPAASSPPMMIPLTSAPDGDGGRSVVYPWVEPAEFCSRLEQAIAEEGPPPVLAFAVRSELPLRPAWDHVLENLDWLAGHRELGARFVTASDAAVRLRAVPQRAAA
jgi:hypothetical protein